MGLNMNSASSKHEFLSDPYPHQNMGRLGKPGKLDAELQLEQGKHLQRVQTPNQLLLTVNLDKRSNRKSTPFSYHLDQYE